MKQKREHTTVLIFCLGMLFCQLNVHAQHPTVLPLFGVKQNSISIANINTVALDFIEPGNAGMPIQAVSNNSKWLNYDITLTPPEPTYSISVEISSGTIPNGMELKVQAGSYTGTGGGSPGTPTGWITLSNSPQILIDNIGTCDTGTGINVGHQLTYTMSISNYAALQSSFSSLNILYTITQ